MIVERGNLVIEITNHIFVLMPLFKLILDGTHIIEASCKKQVDEFDSGPIVCFQIICSIKRIDDFPVYKLSLEAFQMSTLSELVLFLLFKIFLLSLV